jgi:hypothetical protein
MVRSDHGYRVCKVMRSSIRLTAATKAESIVGSKRVGPAIALFPKPLQ